MNPVENAVLPLKVEAVDRAEKEAKNIINILLKKLEENQWDNEKVAPYPDYFRSKGMSDLQRRLAINAYNLSNRITDHTQGTRRPNDPDIRKRSPQKEKKFIKQSRDDAAMQYDAFVAKLVKKIGHCDAATIEGSHVWGYSILTITKGNEVERWKTTQIVNQSKLGLLFNQWPSRKLVGNSNKEKEIFYD